MCYLRQNDRCQASGGKCHNEGDCIYTRDDLEWLQFLSTRKGTPRPELAGPLNRELERINGHPLQS